MGDALTGGRRFYSAFPYLPHSANASDAAKRFMAAVRRPKRPATPARGAPRRQGDLAAGVPRAHERRPAAPYAHRRHHDALRTSRRG